MLQDIYCRLCALKTENYINIYADEGQKLNLSSKIIQCLQIWLYPDDILPKVVCCECCNKVNFFYEFFQLSSQSQKSLMTLFTKEKNMEDKSVAVTDLKEININNTIHPEYVQEVVSTEMREECIQYTNLESPQKNTFQQNTDISSKQCEIEKDTSTEHQFQQPAIATEPTLPPRNEFMERDEADEKSDDDDMKDTLNEITTWKCAKCGCQLHTLVDLKKHYRKVHNQDPVYACEGCSKTYTRYRSYARHIKIHSSPKKHICGICGKRFSQKTVLQSHAAVHSEERPHMCSQCGKTFKQASSLYLHSKRHLPPDAKPKFSCNHCSKEFSTKHTLETHLKLHLGVRNYVCDICGKSFIAKNSLDYHIMTHSDNKPHSCNVCCKSFKTYRLMVKHSSLHTGIKPHQCEVCGKQFRERSALKEHNRIHTGDMPYSCEYCGKLFRFKGILTVHIRQHTGERPYDCGECHKKFTNWANYNKHMKRRHSGSSLLQSPTDSPNTEQVTQPQVLNTPTTHYDSNYKVPEDNIYRINYVPSLNYFMSPIQSTVLQNRNQ